MNPDTVKLLADAINKLLRDVGLSSDEFLAALMTAPVDDKSKELVRQVVTNQFARDAAQSPEPTPKELTAWLAELDRVRTAPQVLRKKLKDIRRKLPRTPGGPQRRIPLADEPRVCAEFDALVRQGCERRDAVQRIATRNDADERTVYRILKKHGKTKPRRPRKTAVK